MSSGQDIYFYFYCSSTVKHIATLRKALYELSFMYLHF